MRWDGRLVSQSLHWWAQFGVSINDFSSANIRMYNPYQCNVMHYCMLYFLCVCVSVFFERCIYQGPIQTGIYEAGQPLVASRDLVKHVDFDRRLVNSTSVEVATAAGKGSNLFFHVGTDHLG